MEECEKSGWETLVYLLNNYPVFFERANLLERVERIEVVYEDGELGVNTVRHEFGKSGRQILDWSNRSARFELNANVLESLCHSDVLLWPRLF